jgi:phosphate transport system substrate-binding protein
MKAKSIELTAYLPFDESSQVARVPSSLKLEGDLPILDGAAALYPIFAAVVQATYPEDAVRFDGTDFAADSALQYRNTRGAYKAIVDGEVDLIFCVDPSEEQLAYAADKGVELVFLPIGREAFVFLVNEKNPIETLTQEQIRGIYSGRYTNWSQVGGADRLIDPLQRNAGSGSQSQMERFMGGEPMKKPLFGFLGGAIGFSFRFYVEDLVAYGGVKMIAVDGVEPSAENVRSGAYPIVTNLYAVYRKGDDNPNLALLLDWLLSEEGQALVEATGYVGVMK